MANTLTFDQVSTILNAIVKQATGQESIAPVDTASFVALGQKALQVGYDPLATAISQVLSRTIFSIRPYSEHFKGLRVDNAKYGNHVRKLTSIDREFVDSKVYALTDGQAIDQYEVRKPKVLQTNFYGEEVFQDFVTIYTVQIDSAMQSPEQFGEFISMIVQNVTDRITQGNENMARMTLANMIGAKASADTGNVIHLLTEYNAYTGSNFTATTIKAPANYDGFIKWAYARIRNISDLFTERSSKFHMNLTDSTVMRHTPYSNQKLYLSSFDMNQIDTRVLSSAFNEDRLRMMDYEPVNFWQSIETPGSISVTPSYISAAGAVVEAEEAVTVSNIFGVLFDEEAVGYTITDESIERTPYNARGKYYNQFYSNCRKYWNDLTENFVVFCID